MPIVLQLTTVAAAVLALLTVPSRPALAAQEHGPRGTGRFAMRDGLFKSTDAGESWKPAGKGLKNLAAVAVNPKRPNEVYAATADGVIYQSPDGGTTWARQP